MLSLLRRAPRETRRCVLSRLLSPYRGVPAPLVYWLVVVTLTPAFSCSGSQPELTYRDEAQPQEGTAGAAADSEPAPDFCAVRSVLASKCQGCHHTPPEHGAPFALETYDDTQVRDSHDQPRYLLMQQVIESGMMPPSYLKLEPPPEPLTDSEQQLLLAWCDAGAPGPTGDAGCPGE